jgi:uncharacterized protein
LGESQQGAALFELKTENPLDNSPFIQAYSIVENAKDLKLKVTDLIANKEKTALIKPENYVTAEIGLLTLKDIIKELENLV